MPTAPDLSSSGVRAAPAAAPTLLAIATSSEWCSVALARGGAQAMRVDCASERLGSAQSERLLSMVEELLAGAGLAAADLDAIAFDAGPGAFTGLRIGCAVAQGLGMGLGRPLVAVGSLETLAWQAVRPEPCESRTVLAAIDARMGEVYAAAYRVEPAEGGPSVRALVDPFVADAATAARRLQAALGERERASAVAIGDAAARRACLDPIGLGGGSTAAFPAADALAELAIGRLVSGEAIDPADAAPVYVRDKVALDVDEQRALRAGRTAGAGSC